MLDVINVEKGTPLSTWGQWRRDPTIYISFTEDRILSAFCMDRGVTSDRWMDRRGPCDEMYKPIAENVDALG